MSEAYASPAISTRPIESDAAAAALVERLERASSIALDTEGDGMFRYRGQLCTLQLCSAEEIAVVDTLAVKISPLFARLLGRQGPEKIVHDASFDARVLFANGVVLGRVFDTAVAARFLGFASTGLSSLLIKLFGVHLPKHQQQADWGKRPIDEEAMRYLEDDVRYLPELAERLLTEVRERGIEAEVREECAYVLAEAQRPERVEPAWTRIKGSALRPPVERARLYELALVRDELAREHDVPAGRLIPGDVLLRIAREDGISAETIQRLLGSKVQHSVRFEEALARAALRSDAPADEVARALPPPPSPAELARRKRRKSWLTEFRAREAKQRGVDLQVVLPGHCLAEIVELDILSEESLRAVGGFGDVRFERYGAALLQMRVALGE